MKTSIKHTTIQNQNLVQTKVNESSSMDANMNISNSSWTTTQANKHNHSSSSNSTSNPSYPIEQKQNKKNKIFATSNRF